MIFGLQVAIWLGAGVSLLALLYRRRKHRREAVEFFRRAA